MADEEIRLGPDHEAEPRGLTRVPPPAAGEPPPPVPEQGWIERIVLLVAARPLAAAAAILLLLVLLHLAILNAAGEASLVFVNGTFFLADPVTGAEIALLALIAWCIIVPTLLARACLDSFRALAPVLACDERAFAEGSAELADPFVMQRIVLALFWAMIPTPVFGPLYQSAIQGGEAGLPLLTIWMYARMALAFGILGSTITYAVMLHYRFATLTGGWVRIDLFDASPLQPAAGYAMRAAFLLAVIVATAGPVVAGPAAGTAAAGLLGALLLLAAACALGSLWGIRRNIRVAKASARGEVQAYSRELWRRAYANGRIIEAVAIPAMAAMITVRNEIGRVSDWPGGRTVFLRLLLVACIPALTWFGPAAAHWAYATLVF